jgi:hypothetical protein
MRYDIGIKISPSGDEDQKHSIESFLSCNNIDNDLMETIEKHLVDGAITIEKKKEARESSRDELIEKYIANNEIDLYRHKRTRAYPAHIIGGYHGFPMPTGYEFILNQNGKSLGILNLDNFAQYEKHVSFYEGDSELYYIMSNETFKIMVDTEIKIWTDIQDINVRKSISKLSAFIPTDKEK